MTFRDRIHPQLRAWYDASPGFDFDNLEEFVPKCNAAELANLKEDPDVIARDQMIPGPDGAPDVKIRIYEPKDRGDRLLPCLFFYHGGGFLFGTVYRQEKLCQGYVKNVDCIVVSVEYRLYPEAKFPAFIEDGARAVKHILSHMDSWGRVRRVFVSGQSAGAYITLMLCLDRHYLDAVEADRERITGFVSDSAQITTHYHVLRERGMDMRLERIDEAAPIYHLSEDSRFGNLLLLWYEGDFPCRPEQNILFRESIKRFCPGQTVEWAQLPGSHCNGSSRRNEKGTYDFCDALLAFLEKTK